MFEIRFSGVDSLSSNPIIHISFVLLIESIHLIKLIPPPKKLQFIIALAPNHHQLLHRLCPIIFVYKYQRYFAEEIVLQTRFAEDQRSQGNDHLVSIFEQCLRCMYVWMLCQSVLRHL